jgi:hypothetical protein
MGNQDVTDVPPLSTVSSAARRPGLAGLQNSHLLEFLRRAGIGVAPTELTEAPTGYDCNPLAPARGVVLGALIGAAIWIAGGLAIWLLI